MTKYLHLAASVAAIGLSASCSSVLRDSRSPALLTVTSLATTNGTGNVLQSDVSTGGVVTADAADAKLTSSMKDVAVAPTPNNQITITRYHVDFVRADGRKIEGVDVPYSFDGAVTTAIPGNGTSQVRIEIVRVSAKQESPLVQLVNNPVSLSTIAVVTFYGTDAVGNEVSAAGQMTVNFANFQ